METKPIIDIDMVYPHEKTLVHIKQRLALIGYAHHGDQGIPGREVFKRNPGLAHPLRDRIRHHLYACPLESTELEGHLLFRDFLRDHSSSRASYQELKRRIAELAEQDRKVYAELKQEKATDFIESIIKKARLEGYGNMGSIR